MRKPQTRWTADTETAFLLALRRTGAAEAAAAMIGREKGAAYRRRLNDPGFAARWVEAVEGYRAEMAARAAGDGEAVERSARYDGLSAVRKRAFLRALSDTGEIQKACARVGTTQQTIWTLKKKSPEFAAACEKALRLSLPSLEQIAYERAVEGWGEEVFVRGKKVGTRRRWSERLLADLLKAELAARRLERVAEAKRGPVDARPADRDEALKVFMGRLDTIEAGRKRQARLRAIAEAERWEAFVRAGGFPGLRDRAG